MPLDAVNVPDEARRHHLGELLRTLAAHLLGTADALHLLDSAANQDFECPRLFFTAQVLVGLAIEFFLLGNCAHTVTMIWAIV